MENIYKKEDDYGSCLGLGVGVIDGFDIDFWLE